VSGSWNAHDRRNARISACKGDFRPRRYVLIVDDTHNQSRYHGAAQALGMRETESFFLFAAEYVLARHRGLAELRATVRRLEKMMAEEKAKDEEREKAAKREALKRWRG
jgi:hypothetical protein